ncbi:hypothetical protein AM499_12160 [Bacillus sp. FJAT-22090]|uniref:hypothetical protein n=1 Tax=Bacillus sp. FJAT-22090 TaxID=1581038 RepID=UPI0006AF83AC|nr:hypothetical protein [Bacillus sp. FJAT-22090]ALC86494.1 hypothetical protein AM499_12160 [Bacillus sp. FJAT-22090]
MLKAIIHGKLPTSVWNSEDVVTSSILGGFQYLSNPEYVIKALCSSFDINRKMLSFRIPIKKVRYVFWPSLKQCEPDVILVLTDVDDAIHIVGIEAKYMSPKSSEEDETVNVELRESWQRDQLSRELEDLNDSNTLKKLGIDCGNVNSTQLIYLTNHTVFPEKDIESGLKYSKAPVNNLYWMSWASLYEATCMESQTEQDHIILSELQGVCERKNLTRFNGWGKMSNVLPFNGFYSSGSTIIWPKKELNVTEWNYTQNDRGLING